MVTRDDLEAKARQIQQAVIETREAAKNTAVLLAAGVLAAIAIAYLVGRRRRKERAIVEVYRV